MKMIRHDLVDFSEVALTYPPEHICPVITDHTCADEPWFVFTGPTLMAAEIPAPPAEAANIRAIDSGAMPAAA